MNDRLKYRVWDKENEIWLENGDCSLSMDGELIVLGIDAYGETMFCDSKNYLIEQCTGLRDKNGKLIYKGDIVELTQSRNKGWMLRGTRLEVKYNIDRYCGFGFDDGYALTEKCAKNCIVIGNIHENADLLGEE